MTAYKRKTQIELVPSTGITVPRLTEIEQILTDVAVGARNKVLAETKAFYQAKHAAGLSYLAMGQHLSVIRDTLEPLEKWKLYINLLPNITQATAYRMIWASENAERALPKATREVAITDGYKLISSKKDETFAPGYEAAVKQVTKELGPAPERSEDEARKWLTAVMQAKRKLRSARSSASTTVTIETQEARIIGDVERAIAALPEDNRAEFGLRVAGMIMNLCHVAAYKVKPIAVPSHYLKQSRQTHVVTAA